MKIKCATARSSGAEAGCIMPEASGGVGEGAEAVDAGAGAGAGVGAGAGAGAGGSEEEVGVMWGERQPRMRAILTSCASTARHCTTLSLPQLVAGAGSGTAVSDRDTVIRHKGEPVCYKEEAVGHKHLCKG